MKKIKENEKIKKIKELWDNPKTHSFIVLGLWIIFILFVILFTSIKSTPVTYKKTTNNTNNSVNDYQFTYQMNDILISGLNYNDKLLFYKDNHQYYYNNKVYLIDSDKPIIQDNYDLGILKINKKMIDELITNQEPTIQDNIKQYSIPLSSFINKIGNTDIDLNKAMSYNIIVKKYSENKISIDLTNYYQLKDGLNSPNILTIYYYNIGKTSNFTNEFDILIGGIKWQHN